VDDPLLVRGVEGLGDLRREGQRLIGRDRPARDAPRQVFSLDQFHHQGRDAAAFFQPVDTGDVRVVQGRENLRLARESRQAVGVMGKCFWEDLDGDVPVQLRVTRTEHLPHAALADWGGDVVNAEAGAGCQGHGG